MTELGLIEAKHEVLGTSQHVPHVASSKRHLLLRTSDDAPVGAVPSTES
jgi:hypothetical protein